jgi:NAD(P)-dependent dehydrogenase (short-subunit alcohol dehydrogenase family)
MSGGDGLAGRTVLVTGASSGIGLEVARLLAAAGAELILPVRDRARGAAAVERIREAVPGVRIELRDLDLARLASVVSLVAELGSRRIDGLVANAGVMLLGDRGRRLTVDGHELHFQTNFLGHAALLLGLLPALRAASTRIVVQSSLVAARARIDWDDLRLERRYGTFRAYGASKVALGGFALELGRRTAADGIRVDLCHPGVTPATSIAPGIRALVPKPILDWVVPRFGNPPSVAAATALLALTTDAEAPVMAVPSGRWGMRGEPRLGEPYRRLADPALGERVWGLVEALLPGR